MFDLSTIQTFRHSTLFRDVLRQFDDLLGHTAGRNLRIEFGTTHFTPVNFVSNILGGLTNLPLLRISTIALDLTINEANLHRVQNQLRPFRFVDCAILTDARPSQETFISSLFKKSFNRDLRRISVLVVPENSREQVTDRTLRMVRRHLEAEIKRCKNNVMFRISR